MYEKEESILRTMLSEKRFIHSLNTAKTAMSLAEKYGEEPRRAYLTGLLHDAAKDMSGDELIKAAEKAGIEVDRYCRIRPHLLHAQVGAAVVKEKFGIDDGEILSAIAHHTMGCENMSLLEKIIFLADLMEPAREYEGVSKVRMLARTDIDKAIIEAYDGIIRYVLTRGDMLHPDTVNARNYMLIEAYAKENAVN